MKHGHDLKNVKLNKDDRALMLCAAFICILFEIIVVRYMTVTRYEEDVNAAGRYAKLIAGDVENHFDREIYSVYILDSMYQVYDELFLANFDNICDKLNEDHAVISSMYLAPDGVIEYAYPQDIKDSTIGFDMLNDPDQGPKAQKAKDENIVTIAGPLNLVEGGEGIIIRKPIYVDDEFKAMAVAVIDWNSICDSIFGQIDWNENGYDIALYKDDNYNTLVDENSYIYCSDPGKKISNRVSMDIIIADERWHLAVEPKNGWLNIRKLWVGYLISLIAMIAVIMIVYFRLLENQFHTNEIEIDELTGLYNKTAFYRYMREMIDKNPDAQFDLTIADIEHFKIVNSTYGEEMGDEILKSLAKVFKDNTSSNGICARFGGDQFAGFAPSDPQRKADWLMKLMKEVIDSAPISNLYVNYGIYENVDHSLSPAMIADRALLALKSIKHNYEIPYANYKGEISKNHIKAQTYENAFDEALLNKEFVVWYQPKVDAVTEKVVSAEALVRWITKKGEFISPGDFIPVFEQDGQISRLDEYVFENVVEKIKEWMDKGAVCIPISVNLSRASVFHENVVERYSEICAKHGVDPKYVPIELTESATQRNGHIDEIAHKFKGAGFVLYMDDFGSGVSSLESFNRLPFDVLKIDKSLTDGIGEPVGDEMIKHIIELSHFKDMEVVAEGVENAEQLEFLRGLKCDIIQGYYFSKPLPYGDFIEYMRNKG